MTSIVASGTVEYTNGGAGSSTFVLPFPGAAVAGDIVVMLAVANSSTVSISSGPAGTSQAFAGASATTYGNAYDSGVYLYTVPSSGVASSFTFTWSAVTCGSLVWTVVRGAQVSGATAAVSTFSFTSTPTAPAVTATAGAWLLGGVNGGFKTAAVTDPSGWTDLADGGNRKGHLSSKGAAAAGSTGTAAFTIVGESDAARAWQLALPAAPVTAASGTATGTVAWAGTAAGSTVTSGSSVGTTRWAGSAAGSTVHVGSSVGAVNWVGAAAGITQASGTGAGGTAWAGTATGTETPYGSATGAIGWAGTATGATSTQGDATGHINWVGSAAGVAPVPGGKSGTATGGIGWAGTAVGRTTTAGTTTGGIGWAGAAAGQTAPFGSATGGITWAGRASSGTTLHDITVTGTLNPARWAATLGPQTQRTALLDPQRWAGNPTNRDKTGTLNTRQWAGKLE